LLPSRARVVIVGGGVGGATIAYHLAELGETDVVLLERSELTSGSTFHSAGLVGQLRADPTLTRMNMYSVELYRRLQQSDQPPSWVECGGIKLASTPERLEDIRRQISWAHSYGLPLHEITAEKARDLFPLMTVDGVVGAAYLESDGYIDPTQLCYALAADAHKAGVAILQRTRVLAVETTGSDYRRRVSKVKTDVGDVECEVVVDAAGMFGAEVARLVGVRVPIVPMSHQYLVTEACLDAAGAGAGSQLPTLRDPDLLVYWRQEGDGLLMGGYERDPEPWSTPPGSYDEIPSDFNGRLLPEAWERFEEIAANATRRVPLMADVGVKTMVNGPEAFTPDNEFCLGETEVAGFFVAAGFCAHGIAGAGGIGKLMAEWVVGGEPSLDLWHMDVSRFGPAYRSPTYTLARTVENYQTYYDIAYPDVERVAGRPLRMSPVYDWHREHGARFGEKAGWERVHFYEENAHRGDESLRPSGWAARSWSPAIAAENGAVRTTAGLFDETSFAKIEVRGPDAPEFLERVCDNRVARDVGRLTYTQAVNPRGGIEADFTVTRLGERHFWIVTGTAFGGHDLAWLRKQARLGDFDVSLADVTGQAVCFALWGPRAADIVGSLTPTDVGPEAFPFMTWQDLTVGDVPARALQVSFTGEHGWELYASAELGPRLWATLIEAGRPHGLLACGYRALESLRLEAGYRVWGAELTPETNPYEAGLGFCVKLDKPGGFVGADALRAAHQRGVSRRLCCITLDDPREVVLGSEPVRVGGDAGRVIGRVTSGGLGYTARASIAYAYLPVEHADVGARVEVNLFGAWQPAEVRDVRTLLAR
jgi:4-methylaminobutanoate oxidase (formaldehyde-forming)